MSNQQETVASATLASQSQDHAHFDSGALRLIAAMASANQALVTEGGVTSLLVPADFKRIDLSAEIEAAQAAPSRKKGIVQLGDMDSFLTYVQQQGNPANTRIFADVESRTLTAIFNDHFNEADTAVAGWRDHRAVFRAELSKEFDGWLSNNGKPMEQEAFAIFLEDNIADVVEPSGDVLLQVALTLQAKTEVNFSSSRRLDNGQVQLEYTENLTTTAGAAGALEVPREFSIGMRLFKGADGYKLRARLKLRVSGGKAKFWYELDRPHLAIEDAFKAYVDQARAGSYTLLIGKA